MPAQPIYLDAEEEISELIERLRQTPAQDVPVVVPSRSRIGQSRFNFRLLRDYARQFGKRISIISPDTAVQQLAAESGFSAFAGMEEFGGAPEQEPAYAMAAVAAGPAPPAVQPQPPEAAVAQQSRTPRMTMTPHRKMSSTDTRTGRSVLYIGAALVVLMTGLFTAVLVPAATVTLTARAAPLTDTTDITAAPNSAPVKVRQVSSTKDLSQQFKSSGIHDTPPVAAGGSVTFTNKCAADGGSWVMKQGQIVYTDSGVQFVLQSGASVAGTPLAIAVLAAAPGPAGNVGAGSINKILNPSPQKAACLTVANEAATAGGADEVKTTYVSQGDLDSAKAQLEGNLRGTLIDELSKQAANNEKLADTVDYTSKFGADHAANDPVGIFDVTVTMTGSGAVYNVDDVKNALKADLAKHVPAGFALTDNPVQSDFHVSQATSDGHISFSGTAKGFIAPKLDFQKIRTRLLGSTTASARIYLQTLPVESADVNEKPFALPLLPFLNSRIDIKYVVNTGGPATPTK